MPDNGFGTYSPPAGTKGTSGTTVESSKQNAWVDDVAVALTNRIAKDGQTPYIANQPMGGFKLTNLGAGSSPSDSARYDQTVSSAMTTRGDIVSQGASALTRLAIGANGAVLGSDGTDPAWVTNIAKIDANSNFTADQTITHASAAAWIVSVTGGARGTLNAGATATSVGSATAHSLQLYTTNIPRFVVTASGKFRTSGLADPANVGEINAVGYERSGTPLPVQKSFTSAEQSATAAGGLTIAHSLGVVPVLYQTSAICKTAEHGYSIGDTIILNNGQVGTASYGVQVWGDATNINAIVGASAFAFILHKTTGVGVNPTPASWKLIFKAFA